MWPALFYVNSGLYFQWWNSNWDIAFLNSPLDSNWDFWMLVLDSTLNFFPNSQKDWKLGFLNVALVGLLNFSKFIKEMKNWDFFLLAWCACVCFVYLDYFYQYSLCSTGRISLTESNQQIRDFYKGLIFEKQRQCENL